jgi:hypothetical protein
VLLLQVARRKGADGKLLSMGFGFVETDSEGAAKAAIQALQVGDPFPAMFFHESASRMRFWLCCDWVLFERAGAEPLPAVVST